MVNVESTEECTDVFHAGLQHSKSSEQVHVMACTSGVVDKSPQEWALHVVCEGVWGVNHSIAAKDARQSGDLMHASTRTPPVHKSLKHRGSNMWPHFLQASNKRKSLCFSHVLGKQGEECPQPRDNQPREATLVQNRSDA